MNLTTQWIVIIGAGVPVAFVLIGLIVLLTKFILKRCRNKAWNDIKALPKPSDPSENHINRRKIPKRVPSERQPLYKSASNNAMETPDNQISIPNDENSIPSDQHSSEETQKHEPTLVQIQRDRLNQLKAEENRIRPMIDPNNSEERIKYTIDQVQKEFEESLSMAAVKMKHRQDK